MTEEGKLVKSATEGRWAINEPEGIQITGGRTVELYLGGQWIEGHIEYYGPYGGQYFVAHRGGYCALTIGMRLRTI